MSNNQDESLNTTDKEVNNALEGGISDSMKKTSQASFTFSNTPTYKALNEKLTTSEENAIDSDPLIINSMGYSLLGNQLVQYMSRIDEINETLSDPNNGLNYQEIINLTTEREECATVYAALNKIRDSRSPNNFGNESISRALGDFRNVLDAEKAKLRTTIPKSELSSASDPSVFINVLTAATGGVLRVRALLPASGFTISLYAPGPLELYPMMSRMDEIDKRVARSTLGFTNSASTQDYIREIFDVFLDPSKIVSCSLNVPLDEIRNHIVSADVDLLLGNFGYMLNPLKYHYVHTCANIIDTATTDKEGVTTTKSEPCGYEEIATIDVRDLMLYDNSKLTISQREFLMRPKVEVHEIKLYQEETLKNVIGNDISFNIPFYDDVSVINGGELKEITVTMGYTTVTEQFASATRHFARIDTMINKALAGSSKSIINNLVSDTALILNAANYSGYIKSINIKFLNSELTEDVVSLTNAEDIEKYLIDNASEETMLTIFDHITRFCDLSQVAFLGIPNKLCPKCRKLQPSEKEGTGAILISPLRYFFSTCRIKMH